MRIENVNLTFGNQINQRNSKQNFGSVIKTRFFEKCADNTWAQIQDVDTIQFLAKRMIHHLSEPWKNKKNRCEALGDSLRAADGDFRVMPCVRRIFNFNRWYDHCLYFITGKDSAALNWSAFTIKEGKNKKSQIIERHWELVRDNSKRIYNNQKEEVAWNIYFEKLKNPKSGDFDYYYCGNQFMLEKYLHFPYRLRNGKLKQN